MKIARFTILFALLLSLSVSLFAGGFALSGVGSRATSMGGAFRGMADDGTAMFWNPAGLAFLNQNEVSLGATVIQPNSKWTNTAPLPGFSMTEITAENKMKAFPSLFGVYAKNPNAVFGLGVYVPYGLGATWDAYNLPTTMPGIPAGATLDWSAGFPVNEMSSSVSVIDVHPTIGYKIANNLSFGMGISVMYGSIDLSQVKPSATSSYYVPTTFDMSGTGVGFGGNAGIMYKPCSKMSLGFNGRFPTNIPMTGDAEIQLWLNNYVNYQVWGNNPAFLVPATYGGTENIEATLKLPGELGLGASFDVMPNLTLNLDYAYTMWERLDAVTVEMDNPIVVLAGHPTMQQSISETVITFDWKNTSRVSLGAEYRLGSAALRAGFYYDQTPIEEATQLPTLSDIGDKMSGNIGFGKSFGRWTLDLNGQYVMFPERTVTTQTATNMVGIYNTNSISGNLNLGYRF